MRVYAVEVRLVEGERCVLRAHADLFQVCSFLNLRLIASEMGRMAELKASSC